MKLKFKLGFWIALFLVTVLLIGLSFSPDSPAGWYINTTKSELWAISQKLGNYPPREDAFQWNETAQASPPLGTNKGEVVAVAVEEDLAIATTQTRPRQPQSPLDFPLGWYDSISNLTTLPQITQEGMNIVMPYTGKSSMEEIKVYLDRAAASGIKVLVEIPRIEVRRDHRWLITQFVKQLKNHPAVYGWYLFDEPEFIKLSPQLLQRVYRAIKAEDPQHQVAIAFGKPQYIRKYLNALDIVMYFNYPVFAHTPEFGSKEIHSFNTLLQNVAAITPQGKDLWLILQGYGRDQQGRLTKYKRRLPTLDESRYMIYSALLAQADGLLFWTHYRSQPQWIEGILTPIIQELKVYLPLINHQTINSRLTRSNVTNKLAVSNPQVQARLYQNSTTQDLLLIAINHSNRQLSAEIAIDQDVWVSSVQALPSSRSVQLAGNLVPDIFEPYGVHIYQLN